LSTKKLKIKKNNDKNGKNLKYTFLEKCCILSSQIYVKKNIFKNVSSFYNVRWQYIYYNILHVHNIPFPKFIWWTYKIGTYQRKSLQKYYKKIKINYNLQYAVEVAPSSFVGWVHC